MTPAQVVSFLNDYFSEMVEAVFEQNGVLDKFLGDGMMAVFGSMGDMPDHPRRAVLAALRMKALLSKINGDRAILGKPPINIGIGIHTDDVIVGNIGTRKRLEYTVIGDGVNTCSRVEALKQGIGHHDPYHREHLGSRQKRLCLPPHAGTGTTGQEEETALLRSSEREKSGEYPCR